MKTFRILLILAVSAFVFPNSTRAEVGDRSVYSLPMNCAELLPDPGPFLSFLGAVAKGLVTNERSMSKRILVVLALRDKATDTAARANEQNPVDILIRKALCFYREQKEPLRYVPYDDKEFIKYLRGGALRELETHVSKAVLDIEVERAQRRQFEVQMEKTQDIIQRLEKEAEREAARNYERLAESAKRKIR
jgi:hypothetical protein